MSGLNERQKRFADEYIISGVAYSSAIKAGYSEKYAKTNSHKLLDNARIRAYIDEQMESLKSEKVADQQEILETLTAIIRGESSSAVLRGIGEGAQTIDEDMPPTTAERIKAAELLGKRYAMWTDKKEVDGSVAVTIVNDLDD